MGFHYIVLSASSNSICNCKHIFPTNPHCCLCCHLNWIAKGAVSNLTETKTQLLNTLKVITIYDDCFTVSSLDGWQSWHGKSIDCEVSIGPPSHKSTLTFQLNFQGPAGWTVNWWAQQKMNRTIYSYIGNRPQQSYIHHFLDFFDFLGSLLPLFSPFLLGFFFGLVPASPLSLLSGLLPSFWESFFSYFLAFLKKFTN